MFRTGRQQFGVRHAQLALLAAERDQLVDAEQHGRTGEVVREVGLLHEPYAAVQQNDDVEDVEQLVRRPERGEDVRARRRRREDVDDADDDHQQNARETCRRRTTTKSDVTPGNFIAQRQIRRCDVASRRVAQLVSRMECSV